MAWKRAKSLVKLRINCYRLSSGRLFDDRIIKRKVSPFFLFLPRNYLQMRRYKYLKTGQSFFLRLHVYLPFIAILSLFFACLQGLEVA